MSSFQKKLKKIQRNSAGCVMFSLRFYIGGERSMQPFKEIITCVDTDLHWDESERFYTYTTSPDWGKHCVVPGYFFTALIFSIAS